VDLCGSGYTRPALGARDEKPPRDAVLRGNPPPPQASWVYYTNEIRLEQASGTVPMVTLPKKPLDEETDRKGTVDLVSSPFGAVLGGGAGAIGGGIGFKIPPGGLAGGNLDPTFTDKGGNSARRVRRPQQFVVMTGEALRINTPVPEPVLKEISGTKVVPANRPDRGECFRQRIVFNNGRDVFYYARWKLRYAVDGDLPAGDLPPAPNPLLGK
jgi:hypothetical protein